MKNLKAFLLVFVATLMRVVAQGPPPSPPAYCSSPPAAASFLVRTRYGVMRTLYSGFCVGQIEAQQAATLAELAEERTQKDAALDREAQQSQRAEQAETQVHNLETTVAQRDVTVTVLSVALVSQATTISSQQTTIAAQQSTITELEGSRDSLQHRLARTTGNYNTCKTNLATSNNRITTLTTDLNQCRQERRQYAEAVGFASWAMLNYEEFVGRQIGTLARWTIAQEQQYQACSLDLALARQHQNQTVAGSLLRWITGGKNSTAAAMSAVARAGGPVSELLQEMQTQNRNLTTTVSNLRAELSTARETHITELKDKDEAHAAEMASNNKAHADAMAAKDTAHATAMSGRNQTLRTTRRERNTCRTDLAQEREAHRNTTADLHACQTQLDYCAGNATARAAGPGDGWMVSLAHYLSLFPLPGIAMDRPTLVTFLIGGFFLQLFIMFSILSATQLLSALLRIIMGDSRANDSIHRWDYTPDMPPRVKALRIMRGGSRANASLHLSQYDYQPDVPRRVKPFLALLYVLWLGGIWHVCSSLIPRGDVVTLGLVGCVLFFVWLMMPRESYLMEVIYHVAYDLQLPVSSTRLKEDVADLTNRLNIAENQLHVACQFVMSNVPGCREFSVGDAHDEFRPVASYHYHRW